MTENHPMAHSEPFAPAPEPMPFPVLVSIAIFAGVWLSLAIVWVL